MQSLEDKLEIFFLKYFFIFVLFFKSEVEVFLYKILGRNYELGEKMFFFQVMMNIYFVVLVVQGRG